MNNRKNTQTFKKLFSASELKIENKDLKKLGLTHYKLADGKEYYVFNGTGAMYRSLPFAV